ncbi:hypothetical protein ACFWDG_05700 [Peribacillus sp. NPDC060186]
MRNSRGYVYLEMITAFSICIFLVISILPIIEEIMTNRKNVVLRTEAHYLLYERLNAFMDGEVNAVDQEIQYQKRLYEITWKDLRDFPGLIEGCVRYENAVGKSESICDAAKK